MIGTMPSLYNQVVEKGAVKKEKMTLIKCISCYRNLRKLAKKADLDKYLETNKEVLDGQTVIKNTRIQPEIIFYYFINKAKEIEDSKKIMKMIKENYPSLDDEKILMSFLYVIKTKGIRAFLQVKFLLDENIPKELGNFLKNKGFKIELINSNKHKGKSDKEVFEYAVKMVIQL